MIRKSHSGRHALSDSGDELRRWIPPREGMTGGRVRHGLRRSRAHGSPRRVGGGGKFRVALRSLMATATIALAGTALAQSEAGPAPGERWRDCDECPEMITVPAGTFTMGSPASEAGRYDREVRPTRSRSPCPLRSVSTKSPATSTRESCRRRTTSPARRRAWCNEGHHWEERTGRNWRNLDFPQSSAPCRGVRQLGRRHGLCFMAVRAHRDELPAAERRRVGVCRPRRNEHHLVLGQQHRHAVPISRTGRIMATDFPWRTTCNDGHARTSLVGSYQANAFGLYDTIGNAWEWVQDCFNWSYEGAPATEAAWLDGDCSSRVMRGASWASTPKYLRAAHRGGERTTFRSDYTGFRVARTL